MNKRNSKAGFTMLEMLVVMSAMSLLMVVVTAWIHNSIKFASVTKQRQRYHQNLKRVANELRHDIRLSKEMSLTGPEELRLVGDDGMPSYYRINAMQVEFEKKDSGKIIARDRFDLGPKSVIRWDDSEMPDWITFVVKRQSPVGDLKEDIPGLQQTPPVDLSIRVRPNPWN